MKFVTSTINKDSSHATYSPSCSSSALLDAGLFFSFPKITVLSQLVSVVGYLFDIV